MPQVKTNGLSLLKATIKSSPGAQYGGICPSLKDVASAKLECFNGKDSCRTIQRTLFLQGPPSCLNHVLQRGSKLNLTPGLNLTLTLLEKLLLNCSCKRWTFNLSTRAKFLLPSPRAWKGVKRISRFSSPHSPRLQQLSSTLSNNR